LTEILTDLLIKKDLIKLNQNYESQADFFKKVGAWLHENNYVTSTFFEAIINREAQYPTGLHTPYFDVSIPHTDPNHIEKPFIAVVRPDSPIEFKEMGNLEGKTFARVIFVIGFKHGENQLIILQKLMSMFSDQSMMNVCLNSNEEHEIYQALTTFFS
jgi:galactitol PTS system EIIA component